MKKEIREAIGVWNDFIWGLQEAKKGWEKFSEMVGFGMVSLEEFPEEAQRIMTKCNPKAKFDVALPRFADYVRRYGDMNEMTFELEEEKPKEEPKPKKEESKKGD
jgi:hypothetical protein